MACSIKRLIMYLYCMRRKIANKRMKNEKFDRLIRNICEINIPFIIFIGYHKEEKFAFEIGEKLACFLLPNIRIEKLHGISQDSESLELENYIQKNMEENQDTIFIELHDGKVDLKQCPEHTEKAYIWIKHSYLHGSNILQMPFHTGEVEFSSTYNGEQSQITRIEFFPSVCNENEATDIVFKLILQLSKFILEERIIQVEILTNNRDELLLTLFSNTNPEAGVMKSIDDCFNIQVQGDYSIEEKESTNIILAITLLSKNDISKAAKWLEVQFKENSLAIQIGAGKLEIDEKKIYAILLEKIYNS